jgi:hypothetical protein
MPLNIENNRKKQGKYNQKGTPWVINQRRPCFKKAKLH